MFPTGYFADRMFAPRYYPKVGANPPPPPVGGAAEFIGEPRSKVSRVYIGAPLHRGRLKGKRWVRCWIA